MHWRSLFVEDPEGNPVEFVCYDPDVAQSEIGLRLVACADLITLLVGTCISRKESENEREGRHHPHPQQSRAGGGASDYSWPTADSHAIRQGG